MPPNPALPSSWQVTAQQETTALDPTGQVAEGVRVFFTTGKGISSSVFIARDRYTVDTVKAAIMEAVSILHGVQDLKG